MSSETKSTFDQLTEDAMKLMENGEYGNFFNLLLFPNRNRKVGVSYCCIRWRTNGRVLKAVCNCEL